MERVRLQLERGNLLCSNHPCLIAAVRAGQRLHMASHFPGIAFTGRDGVLDLGAGASLHPAARLEIGGEQGVLILSPGCTVGKDCTLALKGSRARLHLAGHSHIAAGLHISIGGKRNTLQAAGTLLRGPGELKMEGSSNLLALGLDCGPHRLRPVTASQTAHCVFCCHQTAFRGSGNRAYLAAGTLIEPRTALFFCGDGNVLYLGPDAALRYNSLVEIMGNNILVYICGQIKKSLPLHMSLSTASLVFWGWGSSVSQLGRLALTATKYCRVLVGADCMFSYDVHLRTGNGHALYDARTLKRIGRDADIIIGDHVWLGFESCVRNGGCIQDGSVLGARSLLSRHMLPPRCMAAGIPARVLREEVLWLREEPAGEAALDLTALDACPAPQEAVRAVGYKKLQQIAALDAELAAEEKLRAIADIIDDEAAHRLAKSQFLPDH